MSDSRGLSTYDCHTSAHHTLCSIHFRQLPYLSMRPLTVGSPVGPIPQPDKGSTGGLSLIAAELKTGDSWGESARDACARAWLCSCHPFLPLGAPPLAMQPLTDSSPRVLLTQNGNISHLFRMLQLCKGFLDWKFCQGIDKLC